MNRWYQLFPFLLLVAILSSCAGNIPLEDRTITLIIGIDVDDKNNLIISESNPVFNKDAKKKTESYQVKAKSLRESRKYFDSMATGEVTAAKIQVFLIGKRVLEHKDWYSVLDTIYRNPTFAINSKVVVVDGPVADIIFYEPKDKPQLALFLKELIDKNIKRTRTVVSTIQELHRQIYEKGMTPSLSEVKKDKDVQLLGTSLLDDEGKYVESLSILETSYLLILKDEKKQELSLSVPLKTLDVQEGIFYNNMISFDLSRSKTKIKTRYEEGKFHFDFKIKLAGNLAERLFSNNVASKEEIEKAIEQELQAQFESLIKKIQKYNIDPIGLGIHARAYEYEQYKQVEDEWTKAFSEANINVSVETKIKSLGATR